MKDNFTSLSVCILLNQNEYPKDTEMVMVYKQLQESYGHHIEERNCQHTNGSESRIVCPSIMELLSKMPKVIVAEMYNFKRTFDLYIRWNTFAGKYIVGYEAVSNRGTIHTECDNLPDALGRMWVWLKNNNHLTK